MRADLVLVVGWRVGFSTNHSTGEAFGDQHLSILKTLIKYQ
jgi:hypothetical protein